MNPYPTPKQIAEAATVVREALGYVPPYVKVHKGNDLAVLQALDVLVAAAQPSLMMTINTWRQDLYDAEGDLIEKDVLFIRGELDNYAVQAPLFEGEQSKQSIDDLMALIGMQVRRVVLDNG